MTPVAPVAARPQSYRRAVLLGDAVFVGLGGVILIGWAGPIADLLGLGSARPLAVMGLLFLPYSAFLAVEARRTPVSVGTVWLAATLSAIWVAGTAVSLIFDLPALSGAGRLAVACVGLIVAAIGVAQFYVAGRGDR